VEEYVYMLIAMLTDHPDILFTSPALPSSLSVATSALSLLNGRIVRASLDLFLSLFDNAAFNAPSSPLREALAREGYNLTTAVVNGIVSEFDDSAGAIAVARTLAEKLPSEFSAWVPAAISATPPKALATLIREQFVQSFLECVFPSSLSLSFAAVIHSELTLLAVRLGRWGQATSLR
jgi:hypothetical protein